MKGALSSLFKVRIWENRPTMKDFFPQKRTISKWIIFQPLIFTGIHLFWWKWRWGNVPTSRHKTNTEEVQYVDGICCFAWRVTASSKKHPTANSKEQTRSSERQDRKHQSTKYQQETKKNTNGQSQGSPFQTRKVMCIWGIYSFHPQLAMADNVKIMALWLQQIFDNAASRPKRVKVRLTVPQKRIGRKFVVAKFKKVHENVEPTSMCI